MEELYVDDYLGGTDSKEEAKQRVEETNTLFKEARLNMRSYATNCEELRQFFGRKGFRKSKYWTPLAITGESTESSRDPVGYWIR